MDDGNSFGSRVNDALWICVGNGGRGALSNRDGISSIKRTITLAKEDGSWKVYDITFEASEVVAE